MSVLCIVKNHLELYKTPYVWVGQRQTKTTTHKETLETTTVTVKFKVTTK